MTGREVPNEGSSRSGRAPSNGVPENEGGPPNGGEYSLSALKGPRRKGDRKMDFVGDPEVPSSVNIFNPSAWRNEDPCFVLNPLWEGVDSVDFEIVGV